ncbi:hypothetical protein, partial [Streptomyces sp. NPDC001404]|uniref:hypothetical protein n=1 Tax=Streptomyces sp. NPDC001404 TaxID=3364571 RepID=UPI003690806C
ALPFVVSNLTRSVFRSVSGSEFRFRPPAGAGCAFRLSLSGFADFIRFVPADHIGLFASDRESRCFG